MVQYPRSASAFLLNIDAPEVARVEVTLCSPRDGVSVTVWWREARITRAIAPPDGQRRPLAGWCAGRLLSLAQGGRLERAV